jgi:hypothetical protein
VVEAVEASTAVAVEAAFTVVEASTVVAATAVAFMVAAATMADLTAVPTEDLAVVPTEATARSAACAASRQCAVPAHPGVGSRMAALALVTPRPAGIHFQDRDTQDRDTTEVWAPDPAPWLADQARVRPRASPMANSTPSALPIALR